MKRKLSQSEKKALRVRKQIEEINLEIQKQQSLIDFHRILTFEGMTDEEIKAEIDEARSKKSLFEEQLRRTMSANHQFIT